MSRERYRQAGVDVLAGELAVERMRAAVESTYGPQVVTAFGGFAAAATLPSTIGDPVVVLAADGVGTKAALATRLGRYETLGQDLVAMCADDVVCLGARPWLFLDYLATDRLHPDAMATIVASIAAACRLAECALVGGETAEHAGLLGPEGLDVAGFCLGVVGRDDLLTGEAVRPGDAIVGIAASGLHANGYSLVRAVVAEHGLDLSMPYREWLRATLAEGEIGDVAAPPNGGPPTLGDALLEPTPVYAPEVLALRAALQREGTDLHGLAHVTGGGLPANVPRALPPALGARLDPDRWPVSGLVRGLAALAGLDLADARATFHGGLGMVAVLDPGAVDLAIAFLGQRGRAAWHVGEVVESDGGPRYAEASVGQGSQR